jgi:FKBP-type peptidyl-prolyl cis-trans isomerase
MSYRTLFLLLALTGAAPLAAAAQSPSADPRSVAERLQPPDNLRLPPATAIRTASGLRYTVLQRGKGGAHPNPASTIEIDYVGWDFQGHMFDSSLPRGAPSRFPLNSLIKGWQEGVLLMSPGDTFRFWVPGNLAYDGVSGGDSPKGKLVFDITLHAFDNGN